MLILKNLSFFLFVLFSHLSLAQTMQPSFYLNTEQTGNTYEYIASKSITLETGFSYKATGGDSLKAYIDSDLAFVLNENGEYVLVQIVETGNPMSGTIETITNGVNPLITNATLRNAYLSNSPFVHKLQLAPALWFKTSAATGNLYGEYKWLESTGEGVLLGVDTLSNNQMTEEYSVPHDSIIDVNFNPALDMSFNEVFKKLELDNTNLKQATVLSVCIPKAASISQNENIFSINSSFDDCMVLSKDELYYNNKSFTSTNYYSNDYNDLLIHDIEDTTALIKAAKIVTMTKSIKPQTNIWGKDELATAFYIGGKYDEAYALYDTSYIEQWENNGNFNGYMPELLVFDRVLAGKERRIYESYLAIKYGVTLDGDYIGGKGQTLWNSQLDTSYNNRIFGYGRDNNLLLYQQASTSSYEDTPYFINEKENSTYFQGNYNGKSSDKRLLVAGKPFGDIISDGEIVMIGDNGASLACNYMNDDGYELYATERTWMVQSKADDIVSTPQVVEWEIVGLEKISGNNDYVFAFYNNAHSGYAMTTDTLIGANGFVSCSMDYSEDVLNIGFMGSDEKFYGY